MTVSQQDPIKEAIESYKMLIDDTINTAIEKERILVGELVSLLSNWIDLSELISKYRGEWHHNLSGVLFVYVWRGYGWIIYEILIRTLSRSDERYEVSIRGSVPICSFRLSCR
jgi:hypothetical protein